MRRIWLFIAAAFFAASAMPANAAFHLWSLTELYTNSTGTLQFIELSTTSNGQTQVGGQHITIGSTTFTLPSTNLTGSTSNHFLLFGTAGIQAATGNAVTPDYIIPNGFLPTGGGQISYFGNGGSYNPLTFGALPTNGSLAFDYATSTDVINSATNFAGATGTVAVPEPAFALIAACGLCGTFFRPLRRHSRASQSDNPTVSPTDR